MILPFKTVGVMTVEEALAMVKKFLNKDSLSIIQEIVFRQAWEGKSYFEIASRSGYDPGYVKEAGYKLWQLLSEALGEKVTKKNFQLVLQQDWHNQNTAESELLEEVAPPSMASVQVITNQRQDWGEAIDVDVFYDRTEELFTLEQWIVQEHSRVVVLLGMGGIGKTALSVKLAQKIQHKFDYLIWRSLRNAPPLTELLAELIQFLCQQQKLVLSETVDATVSELMKYLRSSRCLLILDNAESILCEGDRTGSYREGYSGYGQLLTCVAEASHQSSLVLTSREKPRGLATKEGEKLFIRALQLTGMPAAAVREILQARCFFSGSESEWRVLVEHYAGNPLALKMVAPIIQFFFDSSVAKFLEFLKKRPLVLDDIRHLLDQHFNRLSDLEKEVMYWLAINQQVSFSNLPSNFAPQVCPREFLAVLASLKRRALIEQRPSGFIQQPFVMDYITEKLAVK